MEHLTYQLSKETITFKSDSKLFSPRAIDKGTLAMLSIVTPNENNSILDLGCGYGFVGIYIAKEYKVREITFCDIDNRAIETTKENVIINKIKNAVVLQSDGFSKVLKKDFSIILSNPPYHTDFSVAKRFIEQGFHHLTNGGKFYMVTKRKEWYKRKFIKIFGGVKITEIDGYFVFMAEKR
ncbi:MAG: class I SAM-dependent methyltransferase [Clostridiales bacterium]|nr:class I SAM-dependent methyltransferase [Clostridiales bacterium]